MKTPLLLDFDGVVLRSHAANKLVGARCRNYMGMYMGIRDPVQKRKVNQLLYKSHGHTLLGLQALGYRCNVFDFNEYVYSNIDYKNLAQGVLDGEFSRVELDALAEEFEVFIFSNARSDWVYGVCRELDYDISGKCRVLDVGDYYLKPEQSAYKLALDMVRDWVPNGKPVMFVDDSLLNICGVINNPLWLPIMFDPLGKTPGSYRSVVSLSALLNAYHLKN